MPYEDWIELTKEDGGNAGGKLTKREAKALSHLWEAHKLIMEPMEKEQPTIETQLSVCRLQLYIERAIIHIESIATDGVRGQE